METSGQSLHALSALLQLATISQKGVYTLAWHPNFCLLKYNVIQYQWILLNLQGYLRSGTHFFFICYFASFYLIILYSVTMDPIMEQQNMWEERQEKERQSHAWQSAFLIILIWCYKDEKSGQINIFFLQMKWGLEVSSMPVTALSLQLALSNLLYPFPLPGEFMLKCENSTWKTIYEKVKFLLTAFKRY